MHNFYSKAGILRDYYQFPEFDKLISVTSFSLKTNYPRWSNLQRKSNQLINHRQEGEKKLIY